MKLEPNMYVRTKKGKIYKFDTNNSMAKNGAKKYMVNCSYDIINLIEVGDYVNGYKITEIIEKPIKCLKTEYKLNLSYVYFCFYEKDIKSIVTKEQFSSMEYRLGEK